MGRCGRGGAPDLRGLVLRFRGEGIHHDVPLYFTAGRIAASHGEHRMLLVRWRTGDGEQGNHYCLGKPPLDLGWYRERLDRIASLEPGFDPSVER